MDFNNNQISIVEKLVDDRIYFLKENIFYIKQNNSIENIQESRQELNQACNELEKLIELKTNILKNKELTECI